MVPTKWVYENLHANALERHPDIDGMVEALGQGDLKRMTQHMERSIRGIAPKALATANRNLLHRFYPSFSKTYLCDRSTPGLTVTFIPASSKIFDLP